MVPALFGDDEKEPLLSVIRAKARGEQVAESLMWSYACGTKTLLSLLILMVIRVMMVVTVVVVANQ